MGFPNVMNTGRSGMMAAKAAISTSGHNVANANSEGFSRQRVVQAADAARGAPGSGGMIGQGVLIARVERLNDEYLEEQFRNAGRELASSEEKDMVLRQTEDIFNEMNGDGLNRLVSRFFNEFRKLANEPDSEAVRQSVRESSLALTNDFHRLRREVEDVRRHIDSRLEGQCSEVNALAEEVKDLNNKIRAMTISGAAPNDLLDKRDAAMKRLAEYMDVSMRKDNEGNVFIDVTGVGPLVAGPSVEKFSVFRSPADGQGKPEAAFDLKSSSSASGIVTHQIKGGKMGALLEARDTTLSTVLDRLDDMAFTLTDAVNQIHSQGFTRDNATGVAFFKPMAERTRAAEFIDLSDAIKDSVNNIAGAAIPDAPGDNRIALAISGLQNMRLMNDQKATMDDFFNAIVSDVGVATARNRSTMNQQKDIQIQLGRMRDQVSGVSIDEETANLLQFQHAFDASAKVIQVADQMLKTILELKR